MSAKPAKAIKIVKRSERRPLTNLSEAQQKESELSSRQKQRLIVNTVLSWVNERRKSAKVIVRLGALTTSPANTNGTGENGPE
jgi:hypothetical protein